MCDQNKEHHWLLNDLASRLGPKKDASGNFASMNTATDVIPRKIKGKCRGGTPAAASSATISGDAGRATGSGCAVCKKYLHITSTA